MKKILFSILAFALLFGCIQAPEQKETVLPSNVEKVSFQTFDGVTIHANYFPSKAENPSGLVLLHALGSDRNSWNEFAIRLQENDFAVLAIDFRGHGESTLQDSTVITWDKFSSTEFNAMTRDVASAKSFLTKKGVDETRIGLIGASLGANIALNYAGADKQVKGIVLLSPGLDYKGVQTILSARKLTSGSALFVASKEDAYAFDSAQKLFNEAISSQKQLMLFEGKGHGTDMLKDQNVSGEIINWLKENIR
jgi:esterase/lipase